MKPKPSQAIQMRSGSPERSLELGAALGKLLQASHLICLGGTLGAGKTALARGIGIGWGAQPPLTSPTYNLAHEHRRAIDKTRLYHIDLYRISGPAEAPSLGLDEILDSDDIAIIEWHERVEEILPQERLTIHIELGPGQCRLLRARAGGQRHIALLQAWHHACQPAKEVEA